MISFEFHDIIKSHRNLPHWSANDAVYWVTFRLVDSIPQDKLNIWRHEFEVWATSHPKPWDEMIWTEYNECFGKTFEKWLDAGIGCRGNWQKKTYGK